MKFTRLAPLGCQKVYVLEVDEAISHKRSIQTQKQAHFVPLQLLILSTGAHFHAILSTFKGTFITLFFGLWHPWMAGLAGLAVLLALGGRI